jgi:hypothetical protein
MSFLGLYEGAGAVSTSQRQGLTSVSVGAPQPPSAAQPPPRSEPISWYYPGFPEGRSTLITFRHGAVDRVSSQSYEGTTGTGSPAHEWAHGLITTHIGRVGASDPRLTTNPAWHQLTSTEVLEFVLDATYGYPRVPGRIGGTAQRFGELTVVVSMFEATDPQEIRRMLPGGYMSQFFWLLDEFCIQFGESDVAHYVLCHDEAHRDKRVHLSYLPAQTEGMGAVLPVDLLSDEERRQFLR